MSKKIFAVITTITCAVMMLGPGFAPVQGADLDGLASELEDLCQTYYDLAGTIYPGCEDYVSTNGTTPPPVDGGNDYEGIPDSFTFENNLKYGMSGDEVKYLQIVLKAEVGAPTYPDSVGATGWFGPITKSSVIEFQEDYATAVLAPWGLTNGTGFVGGTTREKLNEFLASSAITPPPVDEPSDYDNEDDCDDAGYYWFDDACHANEQAADEFDNEDDCDDAGYYWYNDECNESAEATGGEGELEISISNDNPSSATIIGDSTNGDGAQSLIPFLSVDFENNGDSDVTVDTLSFTRIGISSDTDLSQLYLYDGDTLLEEYSSFNDKVVTFDNSGGIFTVEEGDTLTVTLKGDLINGVTASKTVGFALVDEDDVTSDAESVDGDFPLNGNLMTTATVADLGKLTVATNSHNSAPDPGETNYALWEFKFTTTDQNVRIDKLVFTNIGTIDDNDLQNLYIESADGTKYGSTLDELEDGKAVFDLSDDPISFTKGDTNKIFSLKGDIVGGTNRTYRFSFQALYDVVVYDTGYDIPIRANQADNWTVIQAGGASTMTTGTLTMVRSSDSPSGNVAKDSLSYEVAKFDLTAHGEDVKVTSFDVYVTGATDSGVAQAGLDNVKLYLDGVQKDSTRDIVLDDVANAVTFSFGNTFVVETGETSVLTIKADIKDTAAVSFDTADTIQVRINTGVATGKKSLASVGVSATDGLTLTVQSGSLTTAKSNALPNFSATVPTGVPGSTNVLMASFTVLAGAGEGVTISSLKIGDTGASFTDTQNLVVKLADGTQIGTTRGSLTAAGSYAFYPSPKISLDAGEQIVINAYADILTGSGTGSQGSFDLDEVLATGKDTGATANDLNDRTGQTLYIATTGSLSVNLAADRPIASMLTLGSTNQTLAKFKFVETSAGEDVLVSAITLTEIDGAATADLLNIKIYDGDTLLATKADVGTTVPFSGLNWNIPSGGTKYLTVKADVGVYGAASSGADVGFKLAISAVTARGLVSGTAVTGKPVAVRSANEFEIWRAIPTITTSGVTLDGRTLTSGANDLYKFQISATGGTVDFYQWKFTYATSSCVTAGTWKLYNNTDGAYEDSSCTASGAVVTCQATAGEEIAAGSTKTYTLSNSNITGVNLAGDSLTVYMNSDTTTYGGTPASASTTAALGNFAWSDESDSSHSTSTTDWTNGFLLENDDEYKNNTQTSSM